MIRSASLSVLTDIGTPSSLDVQQIAEWRRPISAFGVGVAPGATDSIPEVVQHEVSVSPGILGAQWSMTGPPSTSRYYVRSISTGSSQRRVRFQSGRLWRSERHGRAYCREPPVLFLATNTAHHTVGISVGIGSNTRRSLL